jgi:hypothetical protein
MTKILTIVELDTDAFDDTSSPIAQTTWRFSEATEYFPRDIDAIASIDKVNYQAATVSLGENLGQRASLTVTFRDHKHVMNGESFDSGTFFGKWRARYGQKLRGRSIRLIRGVLGDALEDMETRHFFVESTDGPSVDGIYTIVSKDLLKFADDSRAQAPALSNGRLAGSIDSDDGSATLTPTGIGNMEYPASGHICFGGKEIVEFTRSGDTLTISRGQLGTPAESHTAGDRAQLVLYYDGDDVADIIADLLENYASIDTGYIPLADWQAETAANLGGVIYARAITEPTSVSKLVGELIEQAALALWWDELSQIVRLQVLKEIATDANLWDEDTILEGSLKVKDQPGKRISQVWTYFGQRNPADRGDNEDNYRSALVEADLGREAEYGGPVIRKIIGKWVATSNAADRLNQVQISRFRDPPRSFMFDLFHGAAVSPGGGYRLRWRQNQDVTGAIVEDGAPIQVTRVSRDAGIIHVEAEEMLASGVIVLTNTVFLTTTGSVLSWTVPADWNDANNVIEVIGAGGGGSGADARGGGGGGGGAYSKATNVNLTPGGSVQYRVGTGGAAATTGGDTWFGGATLGASTVGAKGGGRAGLGGDGPRPGGTGGEASSGIGDVKFSGGDGGQGANSDEGGGAGGGGAAGPNGNGADGRGPNTQEDAGGGGGAADGGSNGSAPSNNVGGNGGNNRFGSGGGNSSSINGIDGGGGKGGDFGALGGTGSAAGLWTQTVAPILAAGPSGGAGGGSFNRPGTNAANYGAGGGGAGSRSGTGGQGSQGIIVITWTPA